MNKEYNKIKYVDVSDKDNNCFYNSVFKILESIPDKEGVYYNRTKIMDILLMGLPKSGKTSIQRVVF